MVCAVRPHVARTHSGSNGSDHRGRVCGTGFLSIELAQRCGPTSVVIAVDPWTAAIARLRRKIAFLGLNNIQIVEGDAAKMGLGDAEVDVLVSNLGIHNFDEPSTVLEECFRVAKPGAWLCVTTNLAGHMSEFYEVYRATLDELALTQVRSTHTLTGEAPSTLSRNYCKRPVSTSSRPRKLVSECDSRTDRPC